MSIRIEPIELDSNTTERKIAEGIIYSAFKEDPLFVSLFNTPSEKRNFASFLIDKAIALKELCFCAYFENTLVGIAIIEPPNAPKKLKLSHKLRFIRIILRLILKMPLKSFFNLNRYMRFTISSRPKDYHYYLVCIGIDPQKQGKGVGKELINYIHKMIDADSITTGIGLDTENPVNVDIYKHFGYKLVGFKEIDKMRIYSMFRTRIKS